MKITASHIEHWVNTNARVAQADLPRLIRRLCFKPESTRQISFPAGDSVYAAGWDGKLFFEHSNAWVPAGASRWEMGCDKNPNAKADKDYRKRTDETADEERAATAFVFVTPRRWNKKSSWIAAQRARNEWADVLAYDADDLEQWLEQNPAVALQFAEELDLMGSGIESLGRYWKQWSTVVNPAISPEAFFTDRSRTRDHLVEKIRELLPQQTSRVVSVRADSVEEATAFACATLLEFGDLSSQALVVTKPDGWRFVEANPYLKIAIAGHTEVAINPATRDGVLLIVPLAVGDMTTKANNDELLLERPNIYDFEKALVSIGVEESDARRYAFSTGRSWAVFRRRCATNPAIKRPAWLDASPLPSLITVCLLGFWKADKSADRQIVGQIAGQLYETIEADLQYLAQLNDAPILRIGAVWKAKSSLELLALLGDQITRDQLDRFFEVAGTVLSEPDPELELPDEKRYTASVYGKVRAQSGHLITSICDALIKLAVHGPDQPGLRALNIEDRVSRLVRILLHEANDTRWLSLSSHLPALAEAAPEAFLTAVERSFSQPNAPVTRLITETSGAGISGRCWHSGLLWALETVAWAPKRLAHVALILARLTHVPYKSNWSNTPAASLHGLFRSWLPQTAAALPQRIAVLDLLVDKEPGPAFDLLVTLTERSQQVAHPGARPKWRDDDAGSGRGVGKRELYETIRAARVRMCALSKGNAQRVARVFQNTSLTDREGTAEVLALMEPFALPEARDEDKDVLRTALRKSIHWRRNYDKNQGPELDERLYPLETLHERLSPIDLVTRHRWLFSSHWPDLPCKDRDQDGVKNDLVTAARTTALEDISQTLGMAGIERLASESGDPGTVGATLATNGYSADQWAEWIADRGDHFAPGSPMSACIAGVLRALPPLRSAELIRKILAIGAQRGWDSAHRARFLVLAPPTKEFWALANADGVETDEAYWQLVQPQLWLRAGPGDAEFALRRLLDAKRPRTALQCTNYLSEKVNSDLLFEMLSQFVTGQEPEGPLLDSWHLGEMLSRLEKSDEFEKTALVQLEFSLFPALCYGEESKAAALYEAITSDPAIFTDLIVLLYNPAHGEREEAVTEATRAAAESVWRMLHHCKRQPGTQPDGSIDPVSFRNFIDAARELCSQADRLAVCDDTLGQILAHAPADNDGMWPFAPARQVLDLPEMADMRSGFATGAYNKRGVTTRSPLDGGEQERDLACQYRGYAEKVQASQPNVAAMLEQLAKGYEREGTWEDTQANLRKESF